MKPTTLSLEEGQSVGPQVYSILREQIIHADILPGTRLSEAEISKNFSVSRQPVREAFIKLRDEGLVAIRPQRGTFVTKISIDAVSEARFIREAIEADIVKVLVEEISVDNLIRLRTMIDEQQALDECDADKFMDLDEKFHRNLAEFAGKSSAWKVIANMKSHFDRVRHLSSSQKPMQRLVDQHAAIVEAIAEKDSTKAEEAIRYHLREVLRDLPKVVSHKPEMFEGHDQM